MLQLFVIILVFSTIAIAHGSNLRVSSSHVFKEHALLSNRKDIQKLHRSSPELLHTVIFAVKQLRMIELEDTLLDISNPLSENYGKHWTHTEVGQFTYNPTAVKFILNYLNSKNIKIDQRTLFDEYITATASVKVWEDMFDTEFNNYVMKPSPQAILQGVKDEVVIRCESYSLPLELVQHIDAVFKTVQMPNQMVDPHSGAVKGPGVAPINGVNRNASPLYSGYVTPQLLYNFYNISSPVGSSSVTQAVFETINDALNPTDLTNFQNFFGLPVASISQNIGGHVTTSACNTNLYADCLESNLDVQYLMAVAQGTPTTYYYTDSDWATWLTTVANTPNPANVYSISYTSYEDGQSSSVKSTFTIQAIKLGVMGTTIVAASGDDGVAGPFNPSCGYYPQFPASCPYVTAVGGTVGPEASTPGPEIACTSKVSPYVGITTGGGFSNYFAAPTFQQSAVQSYFTSLQGTSRQPNNTSSFPYNAAGRGYPDVALLAHNYIIGYNLQMVGGVDGTSASAPVFAAMITLANSKRVAAGLSKLGWVNPFLYQNYASFTNDIVGGTKNGCSRIFYNSSNGVLYNKCCTEGFYPATGWDPSTGLGSINVGRFLQAVSTMGSSSATPTLKPSTTATVNSSFAPSTSPTKAPTTSPTTAPSISSSKAPPSTLPTTWSSGSGPTRVPPTSPTTAPTTSPTTAPSISPSKVPSTLPTTWSSGSGPTRVPPTSPTTAPTTSPTTAPSISPSKAPPSTLPTIRSSGSGPTRVPASI